MVAQPSPRHTASPKRRRGGQPGNLNAVKHGFYASRFRKAKLDLLDPPTTPPAKPG